MEVTFNRHSSTATVVARRAHVAMAAPVRNPVVMVVSRSPTSVVTLVVSPVVADLAADSAATERESTLLHGVNSSVNLLQFFDA